MARTKVRVYVGTRKGGYMAESDASRRKWRVGPVFDGGRDVFHVRADPRHPGEVYSAANDWMVGPILQRSSDWGKTWKEVTTPLMPVSSQREAKFEADAEEVRRPKHALTNLWHIEPGHEDQPDTLWAGADPHMLFKSEDRGKSWRAMSGINEHPTKKDWGPGAGGPCLHTILLDPTDPRRLYVGLSAAGTFASEDGGESFHPVNKGVETPFQPTKYPEVGQCVHHVVLDPADPKIAYRQDHGGMYVSHDRMEHWKRIGKFFDDDFGFAVASAAAQPGRAYFVPLEGHSRVTAQGGLQVFEWNDPKKKWRPLMSTQRFPGHFGVQREGINTDTLDSAGIYVGTTTGQLLVSPDAGKSWLKVPYQFPAIHSVSASVEGG